MIFQVECPACEGPIITTLDGEAPGERVLYFSCAKCGAVFYPGWYEHCWEDPETRPIPEQLSKRSEADSEPFPIPMLERVRLSKPSAIGYLPALVAGIAIIGLVLFNDNVRTLFRTLI